MAEPSKRPSFLMSMWISSPGARARSGAPARPAPGAYPVEAQPAQDTADRGRRNADSRRDLLAGVALTAQGLDGRACGRRGLVWQ